MSGNKLAANESLELLIQQWVVIALSDHPVTDEQVGIRRELFNAVDRQVRARVDRVMKGILDAEESKIHERLSLKRCIESERDFVKDQLEKLRREFSSKASEIVRLQLDSVVRARASEIELSIKHLARSVLTKECAKRVARVFSTPKPRKRGTR